MTEAQVGPILIALVVLLGVGHALGFAAARLGQPRFVGEIVAGVLVGPHVLDRVGSGASAALLGEQGSPTALVLGFVSWLGLLLLMFVSGSEVRRVLAREQRRPTAWILGLGTAVPFALVVAAGAVLPLDPLRGPRGQGASFVIVLAAAAAVTSIPVISRIFLELGIGHTRFASLVLGVAMVEDVALFAALAVATSLVADPGTTPVASEVATRIAVTVGFLGLGLVVAPEVLRRVQTLRMNVLVRRQRVAYALLLMLAYTALAAALDVNVVFGAFLAGFGMVGGLGGAERERFAGALDAIGRVGFATFIPLYFVLVGARLELGGGFSWSALVLFLVGSSLVRIGAVWLSGRASGFAPADATDLAIAMNARGGPGIVLATIAYEAGIIAPSLFTAFVATAAVTSQLAGWWLGRAIRRRGELLGEPVQGAHGVGLVRSMPGMSSSEEPTRP
ncbi:MAG: putative Na+/H+ antiporter [Actinomycetota bacterium]|nr:MAG: putative Na+/H+ antiporter [Actinomycetota bacterium]